MYLTDSRASRLALARAKFTAHYGPGEVRLLRAPARINIIGEHVDYVSYLPTASLPFGSQEHEMLMLFRPLAGGRVRGVSSHAAYEPFEFELEKESGGGEWASWVFNRPAPRPHWSNYVRGAVAFAQWSLGGAVRQGFEFLIDSTIPPGGGSSSSSAIVVLAGAAIREVNGIEYGLGDLARDSSQAEWYLGTRGGALDHTAICLGRRHHALVMDHSVQVSEALPIPGDPWRWVTFFSQPADKGREVMLEYNERAAVSRLLIPALLSDVGTIDARIEALPESCTLADFADRFPAAFADCRAAFPELVATRSNRSLRIRDRARHHLGEVRRVAGAVRLLRGLTEAAAEGSGGSSDLSSDEVMRRLGVLIDESHQSLRELYEVSIPEVDQLVDTISSRPGLIAGRRLMGGGFGGNVLVLCRTENLPELIDLVNQGYYAPRGRNALAEGAVMISTPGEGLTHLW